MNMSAQSLPWAAEPYSYEPLLTPTSIRLVSIAKKRKTAPVESGTPLIECFVRTVDLNHFPAYEALSYTWGYPYGNSTADPASDKYSPAHSYPISLNGKVINVRLSLLEVLKYMSASASPRFAGVNIDDRTEPYGKTRLISLAEEGKLTEARECLVDGANIHLQDNFGETALHYAAENGHSAVVRMLIRHGARIDILDDTQRTPLDCCLQKKRGDWERVAQILRDAANVVSNNMDDDPIQIVGPALWIDALCIDQANIEERNAQVALMARIYMAAACTRVWLGVETRNTHILQPILREKVADIEQRALSSEEVEAGCAILRRSWFRRKWIVQEFCLAGRVEMYCGKLVLGTDPAVFVALLGNPFIQKGLAERGLSPTALFSLRTWLVTERAWRTNRIHLATLVSLTWSFETAEPRDAIFALLGMMPAVKKDENTSAIAQGIIEADYSRSIADIFTDAARIVNQVGSNAKSRGANIEALQALSWVRPLRPEVQSWRRENRPHLTRPVEGLPGWVPNFHMVRTGPAIWNGRFSACGKRAEVKFEPSPRKLLKATGRYVDQVTRVAAVKAVKFTGAGMAYDLDVDIQAWLEMVLQLDVNYKKTCSRSEALWRTLLCDNLSAKVDPAEAKKAFRRFIGKFILEHNDTDRVLFLLSQLRLDDDSSCLPTEDELAASRQHKLASASDQLCPSKDGCQYCVDDEGKSIDAAVDFKAYLKTCDLFQTKAGLLGLGPHLAQEGDHLWVLDGGRVPFILRPVRSSSDCRRYRFIGESYVHGVMYGDFMDRRNAVLHTIEIG